MEPFVDFGFLEIVAATGLGWIANESTRGVWVRSWFSWPASLLPQYSSSSFLENSRDGSLQSRSRHHS